MLMRTPPTSARPASSSAAADVRRQAAGLRDRDVAGVRAGAADDVAGELDARLVHVVLAQAVVELGELLLGEAAQHEVLAVRDADVDVEVALDLGEPAELVRGDVAEHGSTRRR